MPLKSRGLVLGLASGPGGGSAVWARTLGAVTPTANSTARPQAISGLRAVFSSTPIDVVSSRVPSCLLGGILLYDIVVLGIKLSMAKRSAGSGIHRFRDDVVPDSLSPWLRRDPR